MKQFAELFRNLDETTKTNAKIEALVEYFGSSQPENIIWTVSFLTGRKPKQVVPTRKLREWSAEIAGIPKWLFDECYSTVGDLAETITLLLPNTGSSTNIPLHTWVEEKLLPLRKESEENQKREIISSWMQMSSKERFVWNKLITGGFRVGVSAKIVIKALTNFSGIDESVISHRLMGNWNPTANFYNQLISHNTKDADISRPYPFYLAYQLDDDVEKLGDITEWQAEWKWDGIRSQLLKREDEVFIWTRGEDLINERFPELYEMAKFLPNGTVIDGEIISWKDNKPLPFSGLQKRIGRKNLTKKIIEEVPVVIIAYDILEYKCEDIREKELSERRKILSTAVNNLADSKMILSPVVEKNSWKELRLIREESRSRSVEGLMLKRKSSSYKVGRRKGDWWKWKIDPLTVDAVLIYAQQGHGRRSTLYTDYTFAVWKGEELVPFAKAYSGLTDEEIRKVDEFIRKNTLEKFGPVRTVKPVLVFELAFEGIQKSTRHKSGVAVRFPRISRWRHDKTIKDADNLETIKTYYNLQ
ncbi:MAG: ATP-dependent DNA ligase [Ignavibacteriaceae bacterium]